jgi:hypothetical protein
MTDRAIDNADMSAAEIDDFFGQVSVWIECPEVIFPELVELERPETPESGPSHLTVLLRVGQEEVQEDLSSSSIATIDLQELRHPLRSLEHLVEIGHLPPQPPRTRNANIEPTIRGGVIPQHVLDSVWSYVTEEADQAGIPCLSTTMVPSTAELNTDDDGKQDD